VQVIVSVPGIFHAFTLGRQLEKRNILTRLYTTEPSHNGGISDANVRIIRIPRAIEAVGQKFPKVKNLISSSYNKPFTQWKNRIFDKIVSRQLTPTENGLFLGFAGVSLQSLRRANKIGMTTVVERSSSHIETQTDILTKEYDKYGTNKPLVSNEYISIEKEEYNIADYIMTPSKFAQESFLERGYSEKKVRCVPFGTDLPDSEHVRSESDDETVYFIYVGSVSLRKGIQYLLPAWDSVDLPDAELIVTSSIDESTRRIIHDYEGRNDINFVGWVDNIYNWFNKSSAFVFPTLEEGSAKVVYEAMASGLPIITTYNSGWVGEDQTHGIEVPVRDSKSLAEAMRYLYHNNKERTQMGRAAREYIKSEYTKDDYGERIVSEYRDMIRG
jgi:glycosyltransferase involved in cell wall biosynthesis